MPAKSSHTGSNLQRLKHLSEGLLRSAGRTGVRGNLLEIHHPSAPLFDPVFLHSPDENYGLSISLTQAESMSAGQKVVCEAGELPFQDRSFSMVVLHHVVSDGMEEELAEACRVTARRGVLIVLGLNRFGWRYLSQDRFRRLPGFAPLSVKSRLEQLGMKMQGFAGAGLLGRTRPQFMCHGLSGVGAPVSDVVILQASHVDSPGVTPLRFRKPRAAVVQSAAMRSESFRS